MERRLKLHEKLKSSTKLNKMTVKQGDLLVTLNLKKDIGDPSVEISDKVLYMLEQFVEKQQSKLLNTSISQISALKHQEVDATLKQGAVAQIVSGLPLTVSPSSPSPSKRVRFDPTVKVSDNTTEKITTNTTCSKSNEEESIAVPKKKIDEYFAKQDKKSLDEQSAKKNDQPIHSVAVAGEKNFTTKDATPIQIADEIQKETSVTAPVVEVAKNQDTVIEDQPRINKNGTFKNLF